MARAAKPKLTKPHDIMRRLEMIDGDEASMLADLRDLRAERAMLLTSLDLYFAHTLGPNYRTEDIEEADRGTSR